MRKIRDVLRLHHECRLSQRQIKGSVGLSKTTIADYLYRAEAAGIGWPIPEGIDDEELEKKLFPSSSKPGRPKKKAKLDYEKIDRELRKKEVTLNQLWIEYREDNPNGLQYSQYCQRFRDWKKSRDVVMRQQHLPGEKLFVDYAGLTIPVRRDGILHPAQIFVAVLGASSYTYAEATFSQKVEDWIGSHQRAFDYFGGVPEILVPDNLKSGVLKADLYDPKLNPTYAEMAAHYQTAILPARVGKPKDKAKAEAGVQLVERWICAALRNQEFANLEHLNKVISQLLTRLNNKSFKKMSGSRSSRFQERERDELKPLPAIPYELAYWKIDRVGQDYHVLIDEHYYSVPYQYINRKVDIRYTAKMVEIFAGNKRIATHPRSYCSGEATTLREHMHQKHRAIADWTPEKARKWAAEVGDSTLKVTEHYLANNKHLLIALRSIAGLASLGRKCGPDRLELACLRAIRIGSLTYKSIKSILDCGLEQQDLEPLEDPLAQVVVHPNIRGSQYYDQKEDGHATTSYA